MHRLSVSGMAHHGWRSVSARGPVESGIGGVMVLLVYMTQLGCLSACLPMVYIYFFNLGISSKEVTTSLAAVPAKSFPLIFVCPQFFRYCVGGGLRSSLYPIELIMVVNSGFWWWYVV